MTGDPGWALQVAGALTRTGCLEGGCLVSFGFEREEDDELLFVVDHYRPGRSVTYRTYRAGHLITGDRMLGVVIAADLAADHAE